MADAACHVVGSTTQRGLTQVLGAMRSFAAILLALLSGTSSAQECTCLPVEASAAFWTKVMYQGSTYVFYGRVESVAPPALGSNETRDQPTVSVIRSYKGNFAGGEIRNSDCGTGVLPGESIMFFLDGYKRIKSCSTYPKGLSEQQIKDAVAEESRHGT